MILDRSHLVPATLTSAATLGIGAHYFFLYHAPSGFLSHSVPSGGSVPGLCYGVAGYIIIAFGCALSIRRKFPHWQIGAGQTWLRWHIWLSLLCVPIALFHAGFAMRGSIASTVAGLFAAVILSGIYGLALQQVLPRRMTRDLKRESVMDQIPRLFEALLLEALTKIRNAVLAEGYDGPVPEVLQRPGVEKDLPKGGSAVKQVHVDYQPGSDPLVQFFTVQVRPYLEGKPSALQKPAVRADTFEHVKKLVPEALFECIDDLKGICHERADLEHQQFLQRLLHGWQFVHVPLSYLLLLFLTIHAVQAIRFVALPW